ncbi:arylesterase [Paucibacter sediminis]|uniref:Arylesterase n=1 Tax=Paucibacter sediminis TaxID=3019553 RepID=A0AA95SP53_9BURK|nr:arylesterase [Paucibacter sp. S2-9]WIT11930.1 arylesterase [Paucibacter sp. S2-9]
MRRRDWIAQCSLLGLACLGSPLAGAADARGKHSGPRRIVVLGDSLSAEYGLARGSGWVALLEARLKEQRLAIEVVNASISGDTSSGGRSRLPGLLKAQTPSHLIIELGGNDALRGLPLAMTRDNLRAMVQAGKAAGARVLLVGMQMPPNYGAAYGKEFVQLFEQVARDEKTALTPFLLAGVAERPDAESWFQPDRIHPLAKAHPLMLDNVWRALKPLL